MGVRPTCADRQRSGGWIKWWTEGWLPCPIRADLLQGALGRACVSSSFHARALDLFHKHVTRTGFALGSVLHCRKTRSGSSGPCTHHTLLIALRLRLVGTTRAKSPFCETYIQHNVPSGTYSNSQYRNMWNHTIRTRIQRGVTGQWALDSFYVTRTGYILGGVPHFRKSGFHLLDNE